MLRFMIHFMGDLHQPLHAASLFSHAFPHGTSQGKPVNTETPERRFLSVSPVVTPVVACVVLLLDH